MVPVHSPAVSLLRNVSFCSAVPWAWIADMAPWVRPGYMPQEVLLEPIISLSTRPSDCGKPWPP